MKNVPIPDREDDFTADPVELFFDLSFVFAFSRLVFHLVHNPTLVGLGEFALLLALIWMAWSNFTWSVNAVAGNSRFVRLVFVLATAINLPMGVSLRAPFDEGSVVFAVTVSAILAIPVLTGTALLNDKQAQSSSRRYLLLSLVGIVLVLAGGLSSGALQTGLWIAALVWLVLNTIDASHGDWIMRPGHFAERHGLIVIVALGEVIVAIGAPAAANLSEGGGFNWPLVGAMAAAGLLAGLLWWSYFDRPQPALEHFHEGLEDSAGRTRFARDIYTYNHFFIVGAILVSAAAVEEIMLHPSAPLPEAYRWMLFAGIAGYLLGIVIAIARTFSNLALERLVAVAALAAITISMGSVDGLWILVAVDALLFVMLVIEHFRVEVSSNQISIPARTSEFD